MAGTNIVTQNFVIGVLTIPVDNWCDKELSFPHCEFTCLDNDSGAPKVLPQTSQQNLVTKF